MSADLAVMKESVHIPRKNRKNWRKAIVPWLFLSPALFLIILVVAGPTIGTLILSLTDWDGIQPPKFIGLENYQTLLSDPNFFAALGNNFKWMALFCTVPIIFALIIAYMVSKVKRGQMFYRSTFFLPQIVSTVVSAKVWAWIYNPFFGINTLLTKWGFHNVPMWLGDPAIALLSVALVDGWRYWGFLMVLILTALHQTDKSLEEAAIVEGANKIQIFWYVILPQLRPTLMLILMLTMIWSFAAFDYVFVMTNGGPGNATELISTYMYKEALQNQAPGYASSIALAMAVLSGIIIAIFGIMKKKGWEM
ncbi:carbohydrate ABC transporter permease [Neobacillus drentensis]|uniref:carbohydrate ABC transporter permease n=1 Tax=Neobacillus drentensis TaxID=220684 RepID=UPI0030022CA0